MPDATTAAAATTTNSASGTTAATTTSNATASTTGTAATTTQLLGDTGTTTATTTSDTGTTTADGTGGTASTKNADGTDSTTEGAKPAVPEKYEFTMPDGIELDAGLASKFDPVARELELSQDKAQKIATLYAEHRQAEAIAQQEAWNAQVESWATDAKKDPELTAGGFDANLAHANAAFAKYADAEVKALMLDSGFGNHPAVLRMFARMGKALGEDGATPAGTDPARPPKTAAERMYPKMNGSGA